MNKEYLANLSPAEAGLVIDHEFGPREVFATFIDLVLRRYISFVGPTGERKYFQAKDGSGLLPYEMMILQRCFPNKNSRPEAEIEKTLTEIDVIEFGAKVVSRAFSNNLYRLDAWHRIAINSLCFNLKTSWSQKWMAITIAYILSPLIGIAAGAALYAVLPILRGNVLNAFFSVILTAVLPIITFLMIYIGIAIACALVQYDFERVYMQDVSVIKSGWSGPSKIIFNILLFVLLWPVMAMSFTVLILLFFSRGDINSALTDRGIKQMEKYLELKRFIAKFNLIESRWSNEFEQYRFSFGEKKDHSKLPY